MSCLLSKEIFLFKYWNPEQKCPCQPHGTEFKGSLTIDYFSLLIILFFVKEDEKAAADKASAADLNYLRKNMVYWNRLRSILMTINGPD
ncbi:hypothetical protein BTJ35_01380 [Lactobacillus delbrueckii subsp. bulgaricus]|nr:hypothetical protein AT236_00511 [Lactobacillus delbrueckii subsp. bulgaricus]KRN39188.1 hypothetical protein IV47_GL000256 [Lactobacillus delbrueckii subsp. bulgaricus ATCC 11842 = JCM 1002]MCT3575919.1 hypothetical protein [Lactobacillus delbrueckii]APV48137.1 hypothetical protein LB080_02340 [Lactobacillus delbrueckii subsp. bulgaricus]AYC66324.1 hypothetical protein D4Z81_02660 [Lactobacillus delbrueckii subsp. bulgaricus]